VLGLQEAMHADHVHGRLPYSRQRARRLDGGGRML
jgi:hypothetical protein